MQCLPTLAKPVEYERHIPGKFLVTKDVAEEYGRVYVCGSQLQSYVFSGLPDQIKTTKEGRRGE